MTERLRQALLLASMVATVVGAVPRGVQAAVPPASCTEIRTQHPSATDGDYMIFANGRTFTVYCLDMAGTPREFLDLVNTGGAFNVSGWAVDPGNTSQFPGLVTHWTKLRLDPNTLKVDTSDFSFSISTGCAFCTSPSGSIFQYPYGEAADCNGSGSHTGVANINLVGTPFKVADTFVLVGFQPGGSATFSRHDQIVDLTGGGNCGGIGPTGANIFLQLAFIPLPASAVPAAGLRALVLVALVLALAGMWTLRHRAVPASRRRASRTASDARGPCDG